MADMHIIRGSQTAMVLTVVIHMDTPAGNNAAGISWATAILRSGMSKGTSVLPSGDGTGGTIDAAELSAIGAGTRFEFMGTCPLPEVWDALTTPQKQTFVRNWRTTTIATKSAELSRDINYFGLAFS